MMNRKVSIPIALGALVFVAPVGAINADGSHAEDSLHGSYGFSAQGSIRAVAPDGTVVDVGPAVAVGRFTFDGVGGCTIADTLNVGLIGKIGPRTSTECRYTVNPDGTGTITASFPPPLDAPVPLSFVLTKNRKELRFIRTDQGAVAAGVAVRQ
jgi:hypothetical protein